MRRFFLAAVFSLTCVAWAQPDAALLGELRHGGYVLYLRHASTDFSQNDTKMTSYEDCANQRNLTDKGRVEARAVGAFYAGTEGRKRGYFQPRQSVPRRRRPALPR